MTMNLRKAARDYQRRLTESENFPPLSALHAAYQYERETRFWEHHVMAHIGSDTNPGRESATVEIEGHYFMVYPTPDDETSPNDFDCYTADQIEAWRNGDWRFINVTVTNFNGQDSDTVCGIDVPTWEDRSSVELAVAYAFSTGLFTHDDKIISCSQCESEDF